MIFSVTPWSGLLATSLIPRNQLGSHLAFEWLVLLGIFLGGIVLWSVVRHRGEWGWRRLWAILTIRLALASLFLGMLAGFSFRYQRLEYPLLLVICDDSESMDTRDATETNGGDNSAAAVDSANETAGSTSGEAGSDQYGHQNGDISGGVSPKVSGKPDVLTEPTVSGKMPPSRWDRVVSLWDRTSSDSPRKQLSPHYRVRWTTLSSLIHSDAAPWSETPQTLGDFAAQYPETPLGDAIRVAISQSADDSPVAIVLQTDGIVTRGPDLVQASEWASRAGIPLFFIETGSEFPSCDLSLGHVSVDDTVFLGETVGLDATLTAVEFSTNTHKSASSEQDKRQVSSPLLAETSGISSQGRSSTTSEPGSAADNGSMDSCPYRVQWRREDTSEILGSMPIKPIDGTPIHFTWKPKEAGDFRLVLEILRNDTEPSSSPSRPPRQAAPLDAKPENDFWRTTIHVREELIRVLMVQDEPGFEYRFLRNLLVRDPMIEFHAWLQSADPESPQQDPVLLSQFPSREELNRYDVIILGDASPERFSDLHFEHLRSFISEPQNRRAILVIAGPRYWPNAWAATPLAPLLPVYLDRVQANPFVQSLQPTPAGSVHPIFAGTPLAQPLLAQAQASQSTHSTNFNTVPPSNFSPVLDWSLTTDALRAGAMVLAESQDRPAVVAQPWDNPSDSGSQTADISLSQRLQNFLSSPDSRSEPSQPHDDSTRPASSHPALILHYVGAGQVLYQGFDSTWRWRNNDWNGDEDNLHAHYWNQLIRYLARGRLLITATPLELSSDATHYHMGETVRLRLRLTDHRHLPLGTDSVSLGLIAPSGRVTHLTAPLTTSAYATVLGFETTYTIPSQESGRFHVQLRTPLLTLPAPPETELSPERLASESEDAVIPSCEFIVLSAPQEKET
ncbi:MAG: hypothetical protein PHE53_06830, partial [Thermoguttaceae bacterium]|nr:hypothetical protein [Thermoguttaceae bacterium]